jgi:hypothetical protein
VGTVREANFNTTLDEPGSANLSQSGAVGNADVR